MHTIRTFTVKPSLPEPLEPLRVIARNLFWSWDMEIIELFRRIDYELWKQVRHNPVKLLGAVSQARLEDLAHNEGFLYQLQQARQKLDETLHRPSWFENVYGKGGGSDAAPANATEGQNDTEPGHDADGQDGATGRTGTGGVIAYFSAEFGVHESLPIYSGGLGILAGDHLKSSSDLGIPLVGVGLMYQQGYGRQYLNTDGWQQELYLDNDFYNMPIEPVRKKSGRPVVVGVQFPGRIVSAQIWKAMVGRVPLFLLDTNIPANQPQDRGITRALYGGDREMRICQEMILGIGGLKALRAVGIEPAVCHMNEGHAAFMALERVRRLRSERGMSFDEACEAAKTSNVFTVHTPVAAGNDEFPVELIDKYFGHYYGKLGINRDQFLALGRVNPDDTNEAFKMPVLAIRMSGFRNGVSALHGRVSRRIWHGLWPELPEDEVPITSITNGVHAATWVSPELAELYERYLGARWADEIVDRSIWRQVDQMPDEELWRIHQRRKERLVAFVRSRLGKLGERRGMPRNPLEQADAVLDPEALTIGFARRFATYKRGNLLLREPKRLLKLLADTDRPIQFLFAGKAHPRDIEGKQIIRQLVHFAKAHKVQNRFVFLEDYDIDIARYMVQGVDVWLNNPRRPMEASGTSGMKAALNGVLNMSTLDGWWCEGYVPDGGWVIGAGEEYDDHEYQDQVESQAIFDLLESEVVPLFYDRVKGRLPRRWIHRMKTTIKWCAPRFNTHRMVAEYTRKAYRPATDRWQTLTADNMERIRNLSAWKRQVVDAWPDLAIEKVEVQADDGSQVADLNRHQPQLQVGSQVKVRAQVKLGRLKPDDLAVQIYHGPADSDGTIRRGRATRMQYTGSVNGNGLAMFEGAIPCETSGQHGFALRILPSHPDLADPYEPGLVLWEGQSSQ